MKATDLFIECLQTEGVEFVFTVPGEENPDLLESLRTSDIEVVVTRHEQAATFMAAAYARLTGKVQGFLPPARADGVSNSRWNGSAAHGSKSSFRPWLRRKGLTAS